MDPMNSADQPRAPDLVEWVEPPPEMVEAARCAVFWAGLRRACRGEFVAVDLEYRQPL